jgi:hypothetical protein
LGSTIHLTIGNLELDWGQNYGFLDHSSLFAVTDLKSVPYDYVAGDGSSKVEMKQGFSGPLRSVVDRLSLLGYSLENAEPAFNQMVEEEILEQAIANNRCVGFRELAALFSALDVTSTELVPGEADEDYDPSELSADEIFNRTRLGLSNSSDVATAVKQLTQSIHPYWVLTLLSGNTANLHTPVEWRFADVAEHFTGREMFVRGLDAEVKFLFVTEGSSDSNVIRKAFELLRPNVADFFTFVDMEDGYPFTGTGNLYRFCQGLVSIAIQNKVLVVYDNDAEGTTRYSDTSRLRLPRHMRVMKLPDHSSFRSFRTEGPNGLSIDDINGRASAIECFLDLAWHQNDEPRVRWTSFNRTLNAYQGELVGKERYVRFFLDLKHREAGYNFDKLCMVVDAIGRECAQIAAQDAERFFVDHP